LTTKDVSNGIFLANEYAHVYSNIAQIAFIAAAMGGLAYIITKRKLFQLQ